MKTLIPVLFLLLGISAYGQNKYNYVQFNNLIPVEGTDFVIARIENAGKMATVHGKFLLFINTLNGQAKQVDFPADAALHGITQVKLDTLQINRIIVQARTVNLDNKKSIDWNDPVQLIVLSTDGQERVQLTDDRFFVSTWTVNRHSGVIVVTGHTDSNNNGKYDKTDKNEILLYNLKTMKLVSGI